MRIAMVVRNNVLGDSRVQKIARSAMAAGHEVLVFGLSDRRGQDATDLDGVPVLRLAVPSRYYTEERLDLLAAQAQEIHADRSHAMEDFARHRAAAAQVAPGRRSRLAARWWSARADIEPHLRYLRPTLRRHVESSQASLVRALGRLKRNGAWRRNSAFLVDYENILTPQLIAFEPDIIHVHDPQPLALAIHVRERLHGTRDVKVLYDAHEWWHAIAEGALRYNVGYLGIEATYIRRADAVTTVTDDIALLLQRTYRLPERPTVVQNLPVRAPEPAPGRAPIRVEVGLEDDVPLIVYAGTLNPGRGVHDLVAALPHMPAAHLAVVTNLANREVGELRKSAEELGVANRLHLLPYVPARSVTWYLRTATIGTSPLRRSGNHDLALATKLGEYIQAGLPMVVTDCPTQSAFVSKHGIGEVASAGDPVSLAKALNVVVEDRERYVDRITPELEELCSWPAQEERLLRAYAQLQTKPSRAAKASTTQFGLLSPSSDLSRIITRCADDLATETVDLGTEPLGAIVAVQHLRRYNIIMSGAGGAQALPPGVTLPGLLTMLTAYGTRAVLVLGDEVRNLEAHVRREPHSPYATYAERRRRRLDSATAVYRDPERTNGIPVLVTAPDLLLDIPHATWLPLIAKSTPLPERLASGRALQSVGLVPSAPESDRTVVQAWCEQHNVEFHQDGNDGLAPDVYIADLRVGSYGQDVVDALAAGIVVIGHVHPDTRSLVDGGVPIIESSPADLAATLDGLHQDPDFRQRTAERSLEYVDRWHSGAHSRTLLDEVSRPLDITDKDRARS